MSLSLVKKIKFFSHILNFRFVKPLLCLYMCLNFKTWRSKPFWAYFFLQRLYVLVAHFLKLKFSFAWEDNGSTYSRITLILPKIIEGESLLLLPGWNKETGSVYWLWPLQIFDLQKNILRGYWSPVKYVLKISFKTHKYNIVCTIIMYSPSTDRTIIFTQITSYAF